MPLLPEYIQYEACSQDLGVFPCSYREPFSNTSKSYFKSFLNERSITTERHNLLQSILRVGTPYFQTVYRRFQNCHVHVPWIWMEAF